MKISATLIVKDEEQNLPRCLGSLQGLADEVMIVDTGSSDGTVQLARDLGAEVIVGGDRMHKGASRNIALDHASGDWVVILDADEEVEDPAGLRQYLETTDADAVRVKMQRVDANGNFNLAQHKMQCWRSGLYRWRYRAHESTYATNGQRPKMAKTDFVILHHFRHTAGKLTYGLDRLLLDVQENPDSARPLFYLARQFYYVKRYTEARTSFEQYLQRFPSAWDAADAWAHLGLCYRQEGRLRDAKSALHSALALRPRRREWWGILAQVYYDNQQYDVAAGMMAAALNMDEPNNSYTDGLWRGAHAYDLMARALYRQGKMVEGRGFAERAVELAPANQRYKKNLLYFKELA